MCGFVGFIGSKEVSNSIKLALQAMQHRGQDSAGIAYIKDESFFIKKGLGYVDSVLKDVNYNGPGLAVGHVRYPTIGGGFSEDAQPFFSRQPGVIMSHNGNIINFNELKNILKKRSITLSSMCDVEPVLYLFCDQLMRIRSDGHSEFDVVTALKEVYKLTKGAFSITAGLLVDGKPTLICAKDAFGIRPAIWARKDDGFICASESVCADVIDAKDIKDVNPGEVMFFRTGEEPRSYVIEKKGNKPCSFENIYFARPDSVIGGSSIYETRVELGKELGKEFLSKNIDVDIVSAVPDTSVPASMSLARVINKPYTEVLIKNRYSARTFIMPTEESRTYALRLKLNPITCEIKNKKILLLDDSIVRGATLKRVAALLKSSAKEIHLAIHCPPVIHPCFYGIDMSVEEDLVAYKIAKKLGLNIKNALSIEEQRILEKEMAKILEVNSLTFLSIQGLSNVFGDNKCSACFDAYYPVEITDNLVSEIRKDRMCKEKVRS